MAKLAARHCTTLKKGTTPIRESVSLSLLSQLHSAWKLNKDSQALVREFNFVDFQQTIGFVNAVAWIANHENHHPDLQIGYKRCEVQYTSHIAGGLTANDFVCAAKIDALFKNEIQPTDKSIAPSKKTEVSQAKSETAKPEPLVFDAAEANALLAKEEQKKAEGTSKAHGEEDEFELIDPDEVSTVVQENTPPKATQQADNKDAAASEAKAVESKPETKFEPTVKPVTQKHEAKTAQPSIDPSIAKAADDFIMPGTVKEDVDLLATVILPPGMETVSKPNKVSDEDDDSTVIMPDTTATAEIDDAYIEPSDTNAAQDTLINSPPDSTPEMERTMILAPMQVEKITNAVNETGSGDESPDESGVEKTMILSSDPANALKRQPVAQQETQAKAEEKNVERTMVLSSNPTRAINRQAEPQQPAKPLVNQVALQENNVEKTMVLSSDPTTRALNLKSAPQKQTGNTDAQSKSTSDEKHVEKTMVLPSDPARAVQDQAKPQQPAQDTAPQSNKAEENNVEKTVSLAPEQATKTEADTQKPAAQETQQSDPGIEDDETLVMHCNTYKPIKNNPKS